MNNSNIVIFNGREILCVKTEDGKIWVAIKTISTAIGLHADSAARTIRNHPVLGSTTALHHVLDASGRSFSMLCLPLNMLNGWLFCIDVNKVKEDIRPILIKYQFECCNVLNDHFFGPQIIIQENLKKRAELMVYYDKLGKTSKSVIARMKEVKKEIDSLDIETNSQLRIF